MAVIPARFGSTRLPGKPLADIGGKPMIVRVWERAVASGADRVIVATDDARIAEVARDAGAEVAMTGEHASGTDRVAEVALRIEAHTVVNIQGDEPFVNPALIHAVMVADAPIATAASPWPSGMDPEDPSRVKVWASPEGRAVAFSRVPERPGFLLHHGIYAFRRDVLLAVTALPQSPREIAASLEQLRWMDAGFAVVLVPSPHPPFAIDTPADLARARAVVHSEATP